MNKFNPFNPNSTVTPTLFAGRGEIVLSMLRKLEQVKNGLSSSFVFEGERGIGKTALAKFVKYMATTNSSDWGNLNFLTTYYAVEKDQSFEYVLQTSLNQLTDQLPSATLDRLSKRVGAIFKNGKFSIGAFGAALEVDISKEEREIKQQHLKDIAVSIFTNILKGLEEGQASNSGILIIIDEIHNLKDINGVAMLLRNIVTTLDVNELGRVSFLAIGYPDGIERFFTGDPSAKRHFDPIKLECMRNNEAKEILKKGFDKINVTYEETDLDKYIGYAGGYPHAVQILGHHLVEVDRDNNINADDWGQAISKTAIELISKDFSNMYRFNKRPYQKELTMDILAVAGKPISKAELQELANDTNPNRTFRELKKIGAIIEDKDDGKISLSSPLFNMAILLYLYPRFEKDRYLLDVRRKYDRLLIQESET